MNLKTRIATAALAGTLFIAGAAGAVATVSAQEPDPTPAAAATTPGQRFLEKVASTLGIDVSQLKAAIQQAQLNMVDEAEANGRITGERADALRERINSGKGLGFGRMIKRHRAEQRQERMDRLRAGFIHTAAEAIGITPEELRGELKGGTSIADVAAEHSVSLDDVKASILAAAKAKLDEAVANGRITQERADGAMQKLTDKIDDLLQRSREPAATATP